MIKRFLWILVIVVVVIAGFIWFLNTKQNISRESDFCTTKPITNDIGSTTLPIAPKYNHLEYLGQIFTASDCGESRLNQVWGVKDGVYTLGSSVVIERADQNLIIALQTVGYKKTKEDPETWELDKEIKVDELLKLKPYYNYIKSDDCVICG